MGKDLSGKTLGIIHAAIFTAFTLEPIAKEIMPEVSIMHAGDDTVQRDNLAAPPGTIPKKNFYKFATFARFFEEAGVDLIVLACSTFSQAVEFAAPMVNVPMLQIDRPMMEKAVACGKRIGLIGTLASTMPSSERLLRKCADEAGKKIEVVPVLNAEAFKILRAGDTAKHNSMVLDDIKKLSRETDCIVLAQASMTVMEKETENNPVPVFTSPRLAFLRARQILEDAKSLKQG
ncbi:MAG: aspartate/glutamate racemase family protein [Treponema sp.]|nr:aspartate/glutamate racemase family protein [Treponema sp.]